MKLFRITNQDDEIIEGILSTGPARHQHENRLYQTFHYLIKDGMWKHKITHDEASMAYSDTVLTAIESIRSNRFEGRSGLKTYMYQIFSNKCVDLIRKNTTNKQQVHRGDSLDQYEGLLPDDSKSVLEELIKAYDVELMQNRIRQLGEKCKQMVLAWGEGFMDQEIAVQMNYQSAAVVKTSRLRCLEKLRSMYAPLP